MVASFRESGCALLMLTMWPGDARTIGKQILISVKHGGKVVEVRAISLYHSDSQRELDHHDSIEGKKKNYAE